MNFIKTVLAVLVAQFLLMFTVVFGLVAMAVFVAELVLGYFFIWKKGALEWE